MILHCIIVDMSEKFLNNSIETEPPIDRELNEKEQMALHNKLKELGLLRE